MLAKIAITETHRMLAIARRLDVTITETFDLANGACAANLGIG